MFSLPRVIVVLSLVSFFNDIASDMVIPLVPVLLSSMGPSGAVILGLMEGVADAVASALRLWSGQKSDQSGRRKPLALIGYFLSNAVRPLLGFASTGPALILLRALDRVGKGMRSAPRDALIVESVSPELRGRAFGLHRAFDNAGAVLGALLAADLMMQWGFSAQRVIYVSAIPGFLTVLLLFWGVRETGRIDNESPRAVTEIKRSFIARHPDLKHYLSVLFVFTLSKSSETFIMLRGAELGLSASLLLALWASMNATKSLTAYVGGRFADALGHRGVLVVSWSGQLLACVALAFSSSTQALALFAVMMCVPGGLGEGAERAYIADLSSSHERGSAYGWYNLTTGVAAIPAGLLFGGVWAHWSAGAAFMVSAVLGGIALAGFVAMRREGRV